MKNKFEKFLTLALCAALTLNIVVTNLPIPTPDEITGEGVEDGIDPCFDDEFPEDH